MLPRRALGTSGIDVSAVSLGSWRTYERIPREDAVAVMAAARECGIDFLDDARYDDETGTAPLRSGYSEVVFGELFRAAGWRRDDVTVANKLWWEFWPGESAARELDGSLGRMGLDHVDLLYAATPPDGLTVAEVVDALAGLVAAGKVRAWAVLNWRPELLVEAADVAAREGLPPPCATQVAYNLVVRELVEGAEAARALERSGASAVASMPLHYGALSGKYARSGASGRLAEELDEPRHRDALAAAAPLGELARSLGATPAALAIAFSLANDRVASVLFGATRPEQVRENASAAELLERLDAAHLDALRRIGI